MKYYLKQFIFITYSFIASLFEDLFLKDNVNVDLKQSFHTNGYQKISLNKRINLVLEKKNIFCPNPFLDKIIISKNEIQDIIYKVFIENKIAENLHKLTGFKYNIDHITAYETKHIPKKDQNEGWYANHWHKDGPYSKNNIKIIIPLNDIGEISGGMNIKNHKFSKNYSSAVNKNIEFEPDLVFTSKALENILIFAPHLCLHKAGNPSINKTRRQLIFQLNPASYWSVGNYLYENQKFIEPKFPILYNLYKGSKAKSKLQLD